VSALADHDVEFGLVVAVELELELDDEDEVVVWLAVLLVDAADLAAMLRPRPRNRTALSAPAATRDRRAAWRRRRACRGARSCIANLHLHW